MPPNNGLHLKELKMLTSVSHIALFVPDLQEVDPKFRTAGDFANRWIII